MEQQRTEVLERITMLINYYDFPYVLLTSSRQFFSRNAAMEGIWQILLHRATI